MTGRLRELGAAPWAWLAARVVVLGALALAQFLADDLGARSPTGRPSGGLLSWDAAYYVRITDEGYRGPGDDALRFFPLLPLLARPVSFVLGGDPRLAVLVVANVAALVAGVLVERLATRETGDRELAARAAWLLALAPPAFVLVMGYAEPLMMAAVAAVFLTLRSRRWGWAAAAGFAAGLARPLGVLVVVPALLEALPGIRRSSGREALARLAAVVGAPFGAGCYLAWSQLAFGDAFLPLRIQNRADLRGGFANPVTRVVDAARGLWHGELVGSGLHAAWALALLALLVVLARSWPRSYAAFAGVLLLAALSSANLDSLERYALSAIGFVLAAATVLRRPPLERAALALSGAGLAAYATLAFLGAYVP